MEDDEPELSYEQIEDIVKQSLIKVLGKATWDSDNIDNYTHNLVNTVLNQIYGTYQSAAPGIKILVSAQFEQKNGAFSCVTTSSYMHPADILCKVPWANNNMRVMVQVAVLHANASEENAKLEDY